VRAAEQICQRRHTRRDAEDVLNGRACGCFWRPRRSKLLNSGRACTSLEFARSTKYLTRLPCAGSCVGDEGLPSAEFPRASTHFLPSAQRCPRTVLDCVTDTLPLLGAAGSPVACPRVWSPSSRASFGWCRTRNLSPVTFPSPPSPTRPSVKRVAWHGWLTLKLLFRNSDSFDVVTQHSMSTRESCEPHQNSLPRLASRVGLCANFHAKCGARARQMIGCSGWRTADAIHSIHPTMMGGGRLSETATKSAQCRSEASGLANQAQTGPFWRESRRGWSPITPRSEWRGRWRR